MVKSLREKIIDLLLQTKKITAADVEKFVKIQEHTGAKMENILIEKGIISEEDYLAILAKETNTPAVRLDRFEADEEVLPVLAERICQQYNIFPMAKIGNMLTLAMADPMNIFAVDDIKSLTGLEINPVLASETDIKRAIQFWFEESKAKDISDLIGEVKEDEINIVAQGNKKETEGQFDIDKAMFEAEDSPVIKLVNLLLAESLQKRASDIHIEPEEDVLRIRFRIDGMLHDVYDIPKSKQNAVTTRIKIMSKLDITEFRIPQDGRFKIRLGSQEVDFRVSILPISFGEKVVMRLLDKRNLSVGLDSLGFLPEPMELFRQSIAKPYGLILVTGPTGSGKSTTLYSIITQLNTPQRHIITVEDPVEYQVEGIAQVQVKTEVGLTFALGLRSLLRQSPDVILIGEIRDGETADIAVKASLTGQMVLSTLHTNDAPGAITRLIDMGVEPFLVASSLVMACAQRLTRKICPHCKEPYQPEQKVIEEMQLKVDKDTVFYHGKGCAACNKTGYRGRMGTIEVLVLDDTIREMVIKKCSSDEIKEYAAAKGMETLRDNGLRQVKLGMTTLEEILRITSEQ
jgi:type IV pilus assembly protein PilB